MPHPSFASEARLLLTATGISKSFGEQCLLHNINIEVKKGQIVTIIGPNGSGKTTLAKILLGLLTPDKGTIWKEAGLKIGYMPQKLVIDPILPLTVRRFLSVQLARKQPLQDIENVAQEAGISRLLDRQIHVLSGGEIQRVMLAASLLAKPDLLILDEPVQGVDLSGQAEFYERLDRIRHKHHTTIIMISHDLHTVMKTTDHVICVHHHICCEGTPEDVSQHPAYMALFGLKAAEMLAVYKHHHDHAHALSGDVVTTEGKDA